MVHQKQVNRIFSETVILIIISSLLLTTFVQNSNLENIFYAESDEQSSSSLEHSNYFCDSNTLNSLPINLALVDQIGGSGDNLVVNDELTVSHQVDLSLNSTNGFSNAYNIAGISGFVDNYLEYDMSVSVSRDFYSIFESAVDNKHPDLDSVHIRIAQAFEIYWDFGVFYGAGIYLDTSGPSLGNDELELFIVKADVTGEPDMSDIRAFDINGPYNSSNPLPTSSTGNYAYYDFANITAPAEDVILEKGKYFVVANLSVIDDTGDEFEWYGQTTVLPDYRSYLHDGTSWNIDGETRDLNVDLKPSYANGTALVISDPTTILLQDNAQDITSFNQQIVSSGLHNLESNTSIDVSMNNSYSFTQILNGISSFTIVSSTYPNYDVSWEVIWSIPQIDLLTYTNPIRNHFIITPNDWNDIVFSILLNDSPITPIRNPTGYECSILDLLSGDKYFEGSFKLQTSSPNYITSTEISNGITITNNFTLGYWTTDTVDAYGHEGSTVYIEAGINDISQSGGVFNFTLFDSSEQIIDWKNSSLLPPNLIYYDNSSYSGLGYFDSGESVFKHNITIDPSVNESDKEGQWTALVYWTNGTEVGLYSIEIFVEKPTIAEFAWEETLGQADMTSDTMIELQRIDGHEIYVEVDYFNISDPFFSGLGNVIENATVRYEASWGESGSLIFDGSQYVLDIITGAPVGVYTIDLTATGSFLETHTIQFSVRILHQFDLSPLFNNYEVNYTKSVTASFELLDTSSGNTKIEPDNYVVTFNGSVLDLNDDYTYDYVNDKIKITIDTSDVLNGILPTGSYELLLSVSKIDYVTNYGIDTNVDSTTIIITPIHTHIEPEETVTTADINSQITISFYYIDVNDSIPILDATLDVHFDIEGVELISQSENNGLYTLIIRINEPSIATLNIFIDIVKSGYESQLNFILTSISIDLGDGGGIPIGVLIGIIAGIALAILGTLGYFLIRGRMQASREARFQAKSKARSIFQSAMMIKKILVVHHETSLPIYEKDVDLSSTIDPSIVTGVLQAISTIGMEMMGAATGIKRIEYYGFVITSAYSGNYTVYVFSETELDDEFSEGVTNIARWFDLIFGYDSAQWDGSMDIFNEYKSSIEEKIGEELYLWLIYPLSVGDITQSQKDSLSEMEREIVSFIQQKGTVSLMLILDVLEQFEDEEIIEIIFKLTDLGIILKSNSD
jgi:hypothetical protein